MYKWYIAYVVADENNKLQCGNWNYISSEKEFTDVMWRRVVTEIIAEKKSLPIILNIMPTRMAE